VTLSATDVSKPNSFTGVLSNKTGVPDGLLCGCNRKWGGYPAEIRTESLSDEE